MYYFNKIVGWAMSPMGALFLGLGIGAILSRWRGAEENSCPPTPRMRRI